MTRLQRLEDEKKKKAEEMKKKVDEFVKMHKEKALNF